MKAGLIAFLLFAPIWSANAQSSDIDEHLLICVGTEFCESSQKQFKKWYPLAWRGDYQGGRNVAYCLSTGCDNSVKKNETLACAWRAVILASGSTRVDSGDRANFTTACGRLDLTGRATARAQAQQLMRRVHRRGLLPDIEAAILSLPLLR